MSLQSLDQVKRGDWLICTTGPTMSTFGGYDSPLPPARSRSCEGSLFHVLAINPPIMLGRWYLTGDKKIPTVSMHWDYASWGKANETYIKAFLFASGIVTRPKLETKLPKIPRLSVSEKDKKLGQLIKQYQLPVIEVDLDEDKPEAQ